MGCKKCEKKDGKVECIVCHEDRFSKDSDDPK